MRIGLTGPIGCGKSTIAGWLRDLGATIVDADAIAREVTSSGEPAVDAIAARFGEGLRRPDGSLDRAALGRIVFADPVALRDLEAIIHPAVRPVIVAAVAAAENAGVPAVVIEAIKLVEAGYAAECDVVWLISCDPATQRQRLLARGLSAADIDERVAAQAAWPIAFARPRRASSTRPATGPPRRPSWPGLGPRRAGPAEPAAESAAPHASYNNCSNRRS